MYTMMGLYALSALVAQAAEPASPSPREARGISLSIGAAASGGLDGDGALEGSIRLGLGRRLSLEPAVSAGRTVQDNSGSGDVQGWFEPYQTTTLGAAASLRARVALSDRPITRPVLLAGVSAARSLHHGALSTLSYSDGEYTFSVTGDHEVVSRMLAVEAGFGVERTLAPGLVLSADLYSPLTSLTQDVEAIQDDGGPRYAVQTATLDGGLDPAVRLALHLRL